MNPEVITQKFVITRGKPSTDKINLKCIYCNKLIVGNGGLLGFNWEKWDTNTAQVLEALESRAKYHILVGCKTAKSNVKVLLE